MAQGQVSYTAASSTYTETFDGFANGADNTSLVWAGATPPANWTESQTGTPAYAWSAGSTAAGLLVMRANSSASDKVLGSRTTGSITPIRYGFSVNNATGSALDQFRVIYDGEQWRVGTAPAKTLVCEYSLNATSLTSGTWTAITGANFTTPQASSATAAALDGNAAANRVANITGTITGITWSSGSTVWVRWSDTATNGGTFNHSYGIDNVRFVGGTPPGPPTIAGQPGDVTLSNGSSTTLTVSATGPALTYQWYQGASGVTTSPVASATSASFSTGALVSTTSYWVRVSNAGGSADSTAATVTVTAPQPSRFPDAASANILDVTLAPYNADPTGVADATAAIQAAITASGPNNNRRTVYLPNGTYKLTGSLVATSGWVTIQGQSRDGVILRLANATSGFTDAGTPRPVVSTIAIGGAASNVQFMTNLYDLTIDTGTGNPGAIGLRYIGNNQACVRDVLIRTSDPAYAGYCGIDFDLAGYCGPSLLKRVEIVGFEHGIRLSNGAYGITADYLTLSHQRTAGIRNSQQILTLRKVTSANTVPVVQNVHADGLVSLLEGIFTGGSPGQSAIENSGHLFARIITSSGYQSALKVGATAVPGSTITEYTSTTPLSLTGTPLQSLNLPIEETPEQTWDAPSTWISVLSYGANNTDNNDDSAAIQAAIDAATATNRTVYFPSGFYVINQTIIVRGQVRNLIGMQSEIRVGSTLAASTNPVFRLVDGAQTVLQIERFWGSWWNSNQRSSHWFANERSQQTVLRNIFMGNGQAYIGSTATGKTYLEDFSSCADFVGIDGTNTVTPVNPVLAARPQMIVGPQERIWARQLNLEARQQKIRIDGGTAWILGFKTEQPGQLVEANNGSSLELIGGALLNRGEVDVTVPVFVNQQSNISITAGEMKHSTSAIW